MNTESSSHERASAERIPTGFRPKAQGCEELATLGRRLLNPINRNAVVANVTCAGKTRGGHNPVGVETHFDTVSQGSSFLATLGWRTQSLWDCRNVRASNLAGGVA